MILVNKDLRQRIDSCWALRHMEQMRSLLADPLFLPGDFVIDGAPAFSLVEQVMSGMKLFPVQNRLLETYEEYGGAELLDDMPRMLAWMLNAVIQESAAGISPECLEAHGDPGPIAFLLQLDAISAKSPYPGAVELPLHASKPYYMTLAPTARLEKLREGMRGLSRDISSAEDYLRRNAELCDVLMASLTNVSLDYTAPLLSRKLDQALGAQRTSDAGVSNRPMANRDVAWRWPAPPVHISMLCASRGHRIRASHIAKWPTISFTCRFCFLSLRPLQTLARSRGRVGPANLQNPENICGSQSYKTNTLR